MNPYVRERINRKLDTLSDERLYQVLDYAEFLESKYAEKAAPATNVFQGFADGVADKLRAGGMAVGTVSEAMGFLNKAVGVLSNVAQTAKTVTTDVATAAKSAVDQIGAAPATPAAPTAPPSAPAAGTPAPNVAPTAPDATGSTT